MKKKNSRLFPLLVLLRAALWRRAVDDVSAFALTAEEWREVLAEARAQTVTGLAYAGLDYLPENLLPPEEVLVRWVAEVEAIERRNRQANEALGSLLRHYAANGLRAVVLKGQAVAQLYARPLWRECGDLDIYLPLHHHFEKAAALAAAEGLKPKRKADESVCFVWQGVEVELHPRLTDAARPRTRNYLFIFEQLHGYEQKPLPEGAAGEMLVPSPLATYLLLNTHVLKHTLGWGVGLRQLCDVALACQSLKGVCSTDDCRVAVKMCGLTRWTRLLHTFLITYLGQPAAALPCAKSPLSPKPLLDVISDSGNFGESLRRAGASQNYLPRRKAHTAKAFVRRAGFSVKYAPLEAFFTLLRLAWGQIRK